MKHVLSALMIVLVALYLVSAEAQYYGPRGGVVGVVIGLQGGRVVVEKVKVGSGADRAGIMEGDVILAVGGMPTAGRSLDEIEMQLNDGVGSDVDITLRGADGVERVAHVIRESVIEPSDPGLPINLSLPKPHDLRPEDGAICTIASVRGRTAIINCGKNAGVDRGQRVQFIRREDYAKHKWIARGRVTKPGEYTSPVAVSGNAAALNSDDVVAITSAWRSERARENTLWRVTVRGINLLDYPSGRPYATVDQLRFDTELKLEQAAVTKMAERIRDAADVAHIVYNGKISKGRFRGKRLASAFNATQPKDVMDFLHFLNTYPDKYIGRNWYLPEVYATWLINGTPLSE